MHDALYTMSLSHSLSLSLSKYKWSLNRSSFSANGILVLRETHCPTKNRIVDTFAKKSCLSLSLSLFSLYYSSLLPLDKKYKRAWVTSWPILPTTHTSTPYYIFSFYVFKLFRHEHLVRSLLPCRELVDAHRRHNRHHNFRAFVKLLLHFLP